jgi:hypothetical protein
VVLVSRLSQSTYGYDSNEGGDVLASRPVIISINIMAYASRGKARNLEIVLDIRAIFVVHDELLASTMIIDRCLQIQKI